MILMAFESPHFHFQNTRDLIQPGMLTELANTYYVHFTLFVMSANYLKKNSTPEF